MKKLITTAAVLAVLSTHAFAEGDDPSTKAGEAKGNLKATTEQKQEPIGSNTMGQGVPRANTSATTGSSRSTNQMNKEETSSPANPGNKTGVTGGNDGGGSSGSGSGGSGGGSGGSGSR